MKILIPAFALLLWTPLTSQAAEDYQHRVEAVLKQTPLIDGHNDLPWEIRERFKGDFSSFDLNSDTSRLVLAADQAALMTDIPRCAQASWARSSGRYGYPRRSAGHRRSRPPSSRSIW